MEKRFFAAMMLGLLIMFGGQILGRVLFPPPPNPNPNVANKDEADKDEAGGKNKQANKERAGQPDPENKQEADAKGDEVGQEKRPEILHATDHPERFVSLGSVDPASGYRMLVVFTTQGAAVTHVEFNNPRYLDANEKTNRQGYLGELELKSVEDQNGVLVQVVGPGSSADKSGLRAGDYLRAIDDVPVNTPTAVEEFMATTRPGQEVSLSVTRDGEDESLSAVLSKRPLFAIHPEGDDEHSYLLTLGQLDEQELSPGAEELDGFELKSANWELLPADAERPDDVAFRMDLTKPLLRIIKRYTLNRLADNEITNPDALGYHLNLHVEIKNLDEQPHRVSYQLSGPNGLPTEGWWYLNKMSRNWFKSAGVRDVVVGTRPNGRVTPIMVECSQIIKDDFESYFQDATDSIEYMAVDTQYFAAALRPLKNDSTDEWLSFSYPFRVGPKDDNVSRQRLTNVSFRMTSVPHELAEKGKEKGNTLSQSYQAFIGPKSPRVLREYGLQDLRYQGWNIFAVPATALQGILHLLHAVFKNYALAIVLLTIMVRLLIYPLNRKQSLNMEKFQKMQPEMKKIAAIHKGNTDARTKAQAELFRKHNYNPMAGCLPAFIQLPIVLGLYRGISVDIELRYAPLISDSLAWCNNLAAPDMLFNWQTLPQFFCGETGFLGPYFNILPCFTVALYLYQMREQQKSMPAPMDETAKMSQKMMKYMLIMFCVFFFKVSSGLCIYFITSSVWGLFERKFIKKHLHDHDEVSAQFAAPGPPAAKPENGAAARRERERRRKNTRDRR